MAQSWPWGSQIAVKDNPVIDLITWDFQNYCNNLKLVKKKKATKHVFSEIQK